MVFYYTNCIMKLISEYKLVSTQENSSNTRNRKRSLPLFSFYLKTLHNTFSAFLQLFVFFSFINPQIIKLFMA